MPYFKINLQPAEKKSTFKPNGRFLWAHYSHLVAQGFGSGLSPIMPGTVGTLFGWLVFAVLTARWPEVFTPLTWLVICVVGFAVGVPICERAGRDIGVSDHGSIVWDEIIAIWLVLLFLLPTSGSIPASIPFSTQCWAFFWFRVFDMVKPPPIHYFDRHFKGGLGVMWDDIVAAFYVLLGFAIWRAI
jgi:phosphatidylglycerophosphatase A